VLLQIGPRDTFDTQKKKESLISALLFVKYYFILQPLLMHFFKFG